MTPRGQRRSSVPRSKSADYARVAESFFNGAEVAKEFEYWNAAGVLVVHAAIAYADAVAIAAGGVRSRGEDHMAATNLLREVANLDENGQRAIRHLERMIEEKNRVSYEGEIYFRKDIDELWKHLTRFRGWARTRLGL